MFCVYITVYSGNLLPPLYIGSSSISRVQKGYHGTAKSKKYRKIWNDELSTNNHLFETSIICTFATRNEATTEELRLQKLFNVVKNPIFVNEALATVNGFFTMSKVGRDNPMFGKKHSVETKKKLSDIAIARDMSGPNNPMFGKPGPKSMLGKNHSDTTRQKMCGPRPSVAGPNNPLFNVTGENHPAFGHRHSQTFIERMKVPKPKETCPHCGKVGGRPVMIRFHFDKCKSII